MERISFRSLQNKGRIAIRSLQKEEKQAGEPNHQCNKKEAVSKLIKWFTKQTKNYTNTFHVIRKIDDDIKY